jgi:predicted Zn-dependent protease with MMP-like domain
MEMGAKTELILKELEDMPDEFIEEVLDIILLLKAKPSQEKLETFILSESALKKDWLKTEEEEAWRISQ